MKYLLLVALMVWGVVFGPGAALAQKSAAPPPSSVAPAPAAPSFPGVAEVVPRASQIESQGSQAKSQIKALQQTGGFKEQLKPIRETQKALDARIASLGKTMDWSSDRLLEIRGRLSDQEDSLQKLLNGISSQLNQLDQIKEQWQQKKDFWERWEKALKAPELKATRDAFRQTHKTIREVLSQASDASAPLVSLQQEVTSLQNQNLAILNKIDNTLAAIRQKTFRKNGPSFANRSYYRQLNSKLWNDVRAGVAEVRGIDRSFLEDQGWIPGVQILLALGLAGFILRMRPKVEEETREWEFLWHHPFATGIFVAFASLGFLYNSPPGWWRLALWILGAVSAAVLVSGLLRNPRKILMVNLLVGLFVLLKFVQIVSLPPPLYRLYLAVISLAGAPFLWILSSRDRRARQGKSTGFTWSLKVGAGIFLISFLAQCGGYVTLSSRLIESSLNTVFLGLFAAMVIRLGQGGIDFLLDRRFFKQWLFFRRFGDELTGRLKGIFQVVMVVYAGLYLLEIWGVYDSVNQAWQDLMGLGFTVGKTHVTLQMVLLAWVVLYVSLVVSWVVRGFLDAEVFPRRKFDRGIRDSIKKLLHYSLIFVGFVLAMSMAGVELKNFAVLAGAFGIGIGFGLQNIVNNFVSGLILLFERPVKVGDMVVLDGEWGTVQKIGLRSTVVVTFDESEIIVPNSMLISEKVTNWSLSTRLCRVVVPVGVAYGSDVPLVLRILNEVGDAIPEILSDPPPSPLFKGFGDSSLDFNLRVWIADVKNRLTVQSAICEYIDRRFREEDVEIPFPQRDLHLRSVEAGILEKMESAGEQTKNSPSP